VTSRLRTSSAWRSSKGSSGKETRPSGDRQARVRWAPSDGPASDRRPHAQMAPAPSEPRAKTFSSRDPAVHRPFGLFAAAADLLVPAQVARQRVPDPRAARTDRGSRESVEAGAVTLRLCLHCKRHYEIGTGVRGRCGDCGRAYDRELSKRKRARRARSSVAWQKVRALARQRDGNRCVRCGGTERLEVHHRVALADGGAEFALSNLETLCGSCHRELHRGRDGGSTDARPSHHTSRPPRKTLQREPPRPRFSRNTLHDGDEAPLIG
jgi:HNH endonuclease